MSAVNIQDIETDIEEIITILKLQQTNTDSEVESSLKNITCKLDDEIYNKRAELLHKNQEFKELLKNLSCNDCENCCINNYCNHYIKTKQNSINEDLTIIDLFCGAGGLSLGFKQEGFNISLANDIEPSCIKTYIHNHPELPRKHVLLGDINNLFDEIIKTKRFKKTDIVLGGPPCQGFSEANRQRLIDDPRNYLYKSYVKVLDIIQPKFFVMENVKGMSKVINEVKEDFIKIGYDVEAKVLNARDFGVPQNRERLIFIGNKLGIDNNKIFEEIINYGQKQTPTVLSDALFGLKKLQASRIKNSTETYSEECGGKISSNIIIKNNSYLNKINDNKIYSCTFNHQARYNNDRDIEIFGRMYQGDKSDDPKISDIMPYKNRNHIFKDKYFKLENNKICKTITAHMKFDCNMYIHPTQARGLTPREAARVQSYPDNYFFKGSFTKTYMQIGNSVPPLLAKAIAHNIKKYLN